MEKIGVYETKCRRCGVVHEWHYGKIGPDLTLFLKAMNSYIQYPTQSPCNVCEKNTVQDIVSYKIE